MAFVQRCFWCPFTTKGKGLKKDTPVDGGKNCARLVPPNPREKTRALRMVGGRAGGRMLHVVSLLVQFQERFKLLLAPAAPTVFSLLFLLNLQVPCFPETSSKTAETAAC